jgi:effector-binding domain-containing protein
MDVEVINTTERPTAVVAQATTWGEFPALWKGLLDQVYAVLATGDVRQSGHNVMLYKDDLPHVEVGVEVDRTFPAVGRVVASVLPAGQAAKTVHRGPYRDLGAAHRRVADWCRANGLILAGPRWEVYGDWQADESQLETEVYWLLQG